MVSKTEQENQLLLLQYSVHILLSLDTVLLWQRYLCSVVPRPSRPCSLETRRTVCSCECTAPSLHTGTHWQGTVTLYCEDLWTHNENTD